MSILLIDRIRARESVFSTANFPIQTMDKTNHRAIASRAQVIDCTNVSDYWWLNKGSDQKWGAKELTNVMPPFPQLWAEIDNANVPRDPKAELHPIRSGVMMLQGEKVSIADFRMLWRKLCGRGDEFLMPMDEWPELYLCTYFVYQFYKTKNPYAYKSLGIPFVREVIQYNGNAMMGILPNGKPCTPLGIAPLDVDYSRIRPEMMGDMPAIKQHFMEVIANEIFPVLLAMQFVHCNNVKLQDNEPSPGLSKSWQKRNKVPLVSYKTIEIDPVRRVLESTGEIGKNGLKKALHLCRGHFATYTPEKGMMGRKLEEPVTVWKPAHVRGAAARGINVNDYKVKAPA